MTVRDEVDSIDALIEALLGGDRPPDEIVVADAGSTDGTRRALTALASRHDRVRVLDVPGNRSRGRNAAIEAARHEVIASIDGGCEPEAAWLESLVEPFTAGAQWVGGFYRPVGKTVRQTCIGLTMVFVLEEALAGGFFPSARSMAFTRAAWRHAGGFPEWLEVSEDTAFDEAMVDAGIEMVFRPQAVVIWTPPPTLRAQARAVWTWAHSDGVAGIRSFGYRWTARWVVAGAVLGLVGALVDPRLAVVGLIPLVLLGRRETRHKYRWATGWARFVWIPVAWFVGLVARLFGFGVGRLRRRSAS
jgi:glycosyltransferase involved in cell wall biosynthesis